MTCFLCMSLLFNLLIKLLSELMILLSVLMKSWKKVDFDLCKCKKSQFLIFDLLHNYLWSYWVEWELILIVWMCFITCQSIWYIICLSKSLSSSALIFIALIYIQYLFSKIQAKFKNLQLFCYIDDVMLYIES